MLQYYLSWKIIARQFFFKLTSIMHNRIASLLDAHKKYWPESNNAQLLPLRFSLFYAQLKQHSRATEIIAANHLSVVEFDVLATLRRSPPPYVLTPSDIQNSMLISSGGLTKVLLELERRGFVSRTSNESDRRIKPVMLNINTLPIMNKVMIELEDAFKDWVNKSLTHTEINQLTALLMKLSS